MKQPGPSPSLTSAEEPTLAEVRDHTSQRLDEALEEIRRADIVALDLEFSGLFTSQKRQRNLEEYYQYCADSVAKFLAVQIGICTARRDEDSPNGWVFSPFNFHLFPQKRRIFSSDSSTLSWLIDQGFNLHDWIRDGLDFERLAIVTDKFQMNNSARSTACSRSGAQRLIEAIIENQKPLVMHNGILDLLHVYDKFIQELPTSVNEFAHTAVGHFSGGLYDTKRIAEEGRTRVFRISDLSRGATSLDSLRYLLMQHKSKLDIRINPHLGEKGGLYLLHRKPGEPARKKPRVSHEQRPSSHPKDPSAPLTPPTTAESPKIEEVAPETTRGSKAPSKSHEAGYDAMITLHVFLLELEWIRSSGATTPGCSEDAGTVIPLDWQQFEICKLANNSLELAGIAPGKMSLDVLATAYKPAESSIKPTSVPVPTPVLSAPTVHASATPDLTPQSEASHPKQATIIPAEGLVLFGVGPQQPPSQQTTVAASRSEVHAEQQLPNGRPRHFKNVTMIFSHPTP